MRFACWSVKSGHWKIMLCPSTISTRGFMGSRLLANLPGLVSSATGQCLSRRLLPSKFSRGSGGICGIKQLRETSMKEDLDDLLRSWRPDAIESSTFQRDVWRRIEQSRGRGSAPARLFRMAGSASDSLVGGSRLRRLVASSSALCLQATMRNAHTSDDVDPYAQVLLK